MNLLADYVMALTRGVGGVVFAVGRALLRLLLIVAWVMAAALVLVLARSHLILAVIVGAAFLFASGFAWYAYRRARPRPVHADDAAREGGGMPFVLKVILACVIVVLFLKYFVQIRLVPEGG
jgi:hypothetical protein